MASYIGKPEVDEKNNLCFWHAHAYTFEEFVQIGKMLTPVRNEHNFPIKFDLNGLTFEYMDNTSYWVNGQLFTPAYMLIQGDYGNLHLQLRSEFKEKYQKTLHL